MLVANGAIQNLSGYSIVHTLTNGIQTIAEPVASQEAIKDLGTNGGGFFNANSAHPFENPNGFTNALEIFTFLLIPFGLVITFGKWVGNVKQGIALGAIMAIILIGACGVAAWQEQQGNPALVGTGATQVASAQSAGGNMEGKEARFGPIQTAQFGTATTGTSTGSVDSSHDSWTAIGGLIPLVLIKLGEITPGGVGSGLYGMVVFAIIAVFIAGLMVGRTPEYVGKKIEGRDVKYAAIAILVLPASILGFSAIAVLTAGGQAGPIATQGTPHMLTEILYAFTSTTGNNGSAFAGLTGNTLYYNLMLAGAMWMGRFLFIIPVMALAGSLVKKKIVPASAGTFPTDGPLFVALLVGTILVVAALTFFPVVSLGPILEHFKLIAVQVEIGHSQLRRSPPPAASGGRRRSRPGTAVPSHRAELRQAQPAGHGSQPGHVRGRDRRGDDVVRVLRRHRGERLGHELRRADRTLAVVHGAVREFRRGDRRGARQSAGPSPAAHPHGDDRPQTAGRCRWQGDARGRQPTCARVDIVVCEAGDVIPSDGTIIEGIASVDEFAGHHRRIRTGHP